MFDFTSAIFSFLIGFGLFLKDVLTKKSYLASKRKIRFIYLTLLFTFLLTLLNVTKNYHVYHMIMLNGGRSNLVVFVSFFWSLSYTLYLLGLKILGRSKAPQDLGEEKESE